MAGQFGITARTRELENDHGNRKSNALKSLMGNQRKVAESKLKSSVIPLLPDWQSQDTACPDWMPSRAMAEYYEIAKGLSGLDLFTPLDRTPLVVGCCLYELLLRSVEQMKDLFTEVTKMEQVDDEEWEERTYQKEHPLHLVQSQLMGILHKLWKDYGMTPRYRRIFNGEQKKEKAVPFEFKPKVVG
jgi:P27 family predicted phage terminase small subunit